MIGLRQNLNPNSPLHRIGSSSFNHSSISDSEKKTILDRVEKDLLDELPSLPKLDQATKMKKKPSPARTPAPALLQEGGEEGEEAGVSLLSLEHSPQNRQQQQHTEDPLASPSAAFSNNHKSHPPLQNPPPSHVQMTDAQLKAALDRWEDERPERNTLLRHFGCCSRQPPATTTTPTPHSHSVAGAVACLCSATLGAGILSLPYAMAQAGLVVGMGLLLASAAATAYSIQLLVQAMQVVYYTGNHNNRGGERTYEDLVERCLGKRWRRLAEASMLIFCGGAAVAYVIAVGDILQQRNTHHGNHRAIEMTLAWAMAMVPLSLLKTMKSLECASSIGIASIATLVLAALYHCIWEHEAPPELLLDDQSILEPTQGMLSILRACPIILFAFSCQVNVCAIYDEMPGQPEPQSTAEPARTENDNTTPQGDDDEAPTITPTTTTAATTSTASHKFRRMTRVTWAAVGICAVLYSSISVVTLLDFGGRVTPNILSSYNPHDPILQVAFLGMALAVVLAYPMNIFPARVTLLGIIVQKIRTRPPQNNHEDLEEPLLTADSLPPNAEEEQEEPRDLLSEVCESATASADSSSSSSLWAHVLATLFLTGSSLGLALVAPNISVVFGLLGGTSSSVLGFVIPGLLGYQTADEFYNAQGGGGGGALRTRILSVLLVVAGVVVGIVTTAVTVYSTFAVHSSGL